MVTATSKVKAPKTLRAPPNPSACKIEDCMASMELANCSSGTGDEVSGEASQGSASKCSTTGLATLFLSTEGITFSEPLVPGRSEILIEMQQFWVQKRTGNMWLIRFLLGSGANLADGTRASRFFRLGAQKFRSPKKQRRPRGCECAAAALIDRLRAIDQPLTKARRSALIWSG